MYVITMTIGVCERYRGLALKRITRYAQRRTYKGRVRTETEVLNPGAGARARRAAHAGALAGRIIVIRKLRRVYFFRAQQVGYPGGRAAKRVITISGRL